GVQIDRRIKTLIYTRTRIFTQVLALLASTAHITNSMWVTPDPRREQNEPTKGVRFVERLQ
ncbi:MAG: hypothetical protein Q7T01_04440, partial [bacterium]|nr:hypothetical protein [bacterium]